MGGNVFQVFDFGIGVKFFCPADEVVAKLFKLTAAGGFDEKYFMYVEDADLTQKMLRRGQVWLAPQFTAVHVWHRAAHRSLGPMFWQARSLCRYFAKWGFRL